MKVPVSDKAGKTIEELEVSPEIAEVKVNEGVVHQVIRAQLAAARVGTASTKNRSEVRGGGKKPWRQKGTGRARAGSIRSPLWTGGGVTFGPTPRDYGFSVPRKVRKLALRSILKMKAQENRLIVVDDFGIEDPKTKEAAEVLKSLGATNKTTLVVNPDEQVIAKSARNIEGMRVINTQNLNAYDLLNNDKLVMTRQAFGDVQEVLG
ncbi:MAG: 50S ribosomal protein L4 [Candidatus Aquicultorales bacterium]